MKVTKDIEIPEEILSAQQDNRLVIFVGAGASTPPPSNLPTFKDLAIQIANGEFTLKKNEPIDYFLGRIEKNGKGVHRIAQKILSDNTSSPSELHKNIVSLFTTPSAIRIITTNMDKHFTTLITNQFGSSVDIYYNPALPSGYNVSGLVYLHGSVEKDPSDMILTDENFGRAYIIDGRTSTFLKDLFKAYTAVFIGYSHEDIIMKYLARGLGYSERYAFCEDGKESHWEYFNIQPITYPKSENHASLVESLEIWSKYSQMGALEHEKRIRHIIQQSHRIDIQNDTLLLSPEDDSYLERSIQDLSTLQYFVRYANAPEWLNWIKNKNPFINLFNTKKSFNDVEIELTHWLFNNFCFSHPDSVFLLIDEKEYFLNPELIRRLLEQLAFNKQIESKVRNQWISFLLNYQSIKFKPDIIDFIIENFEYSNDLESALRLFLFRIRPHYRFRKPLYLVNEKEGPDVEIRLIREHDYYLDRIWNDKFKPNIEQLLVPLEAGLIMQILDIYNDFILFNEGYSTTGPISIERQAIEPHDQNLSTKIPDVLIDALRDIIEWRIQDNCKEAVKTIDMIYQLKVPILKRIAIHGIIESTCISSQEKLSWLLEREDIYDIWLKHEIFRLLSVVYSDLDQTTKNDLIQIILKGPKPSKDEDTTINEYAVYNMLVWIKQHQIQDDLLDYHIDQIQKKHPEFTPQEHPDFSVWTSSGIVLPELPMTVEKLLSSVLVDETIDFILNYRTKTIFGQETRDGVFRLVNEAIDQDELYSWKLATELISRKIWDDDIWPLIIRKWKKSIISDDKLKDAINIFTTHNQLSIWAYEISGFLLEQIQRYDDNIPPCFEEMEILGEKLWRIGNQNEKYNMHLEDKDWVTCSINHFGGTITLFFIRSLILREKTKSHSKSIIDKYLTLFKEILFDDSISSEMARIIITSQVRFLYDINPEWTKENIFPNFSWNINRRYTQQSWHGYLSFGKWHELLLNEFLPYIESTIDNIDSLTVKRDRFIDLLSSIGIYGLRNPLEDSWLSKLIEIGTDEDKETFARYIRISLETLENDDVKRLWNSWISEYLSQRITGIPRRFCDKEIEEITWWCIHAKIVFPEISKKICEMNAPLPSRNIFLKLIEMKIPIEYPNDTIKLLNCFLQNTPVQRYFLYSEDATVIFDLLFEHVPPYQLTIYCNELARLGVPNAIELSEKIPPDKKEL